MLRVNNVSVEIEKTKILEDISFSAEPGEIIGLVAPNGSGKTTLLNAISNLIPASKGEISIYGMNYKMHREKILKKIFFLQDHTVLYPSLTGREHLKLVQRLWESKQECGAVIEKLSMGSYIDKRVSKYSLGMQQRLLFGMCLISSCDLLLMDEPMNGLDPSNIKLISESIKQLRDENKIVLFSSHILNNVDELCDRVIFLKQGRMVYESRKNNPDFNKYIIIKLENGNDADKVLSLFKDEEIKNATANEVWAEIDSSKSSFVVNQAFEQDMKFKSFFIGQKGSQQIYEEIYEGEDKWG